MTQYKVYTIHKGGDSETLRWKGTVRKTAFEEGNRWAGKGYLTDIVKVTPKGKELLLETYFPGLTHQ
jgi:hypothetical protein